jgi:peptidoglycan/LPS O-acetylase OafA/YrhL
VNPETARAPELENALRNVRRGVLATLAVSALVIATTAADGISPSPPAGFPIAAIALGLGSVLARHAAVATRSRTRILFALASPLLAAGVGLVGVALALQDGPRTTSLAYALGGALLCLRPALRSAPR